MISFENNFANYGPDIASYPIKSYFMKKINGEYQIQNSSLKIELIRPSSDAPINNEEIILGMFDYDEQIVEKEEQLFINLFKQYIIYFKIRENADTAKS